MFWKKGAQEDRRRYYRLEKRFKTRYGLIRIDNKLSVQYSLRDSVELKYIGHTKDVCERGLCLQNDDLKKLLKTNIKEGTELKLEILFHDKDIGNLNTVGRVTWMNLKNHICGIEFISILHEDRLKIRNYVRDEYFKSYKK